MITQSQKMCGITWSPLPFHERKDATDVERIVANLHLCPNHLTIIEFLRPVELIMNLDALSIRYLHFFSSFRCWQGLHEKLQIILNVAIGAYPAQDYASIIFLAWRSFECGVVFIIIDVIAPLAESPVKCG